MPESDDLDPFLTCIDAIDHSIGANDNLSYFIPPELRNHPAHLWKISEAFSVPHQEFTERHGALRRIE